MCFLGRGKKTPQKNNSKNPEKHPHFFKKLILFTSFDKKFNLTYVIMLATFKSIIKYFDIKISKNKLIYKIFYISNNNLK